MKEWQKAIINAAIMGLLSFVGMAMAFQGEITLRMFVGAGLSALFVFLSLCGRYFQPPKTDINDEEIPEAETTGGKALVKSQVSSSILGVLWV